MFKFWKTRKDDGTEEFNYSGTIEAKMGEIIGHRLRVEVVEKLADAWINENGFELVNNIAPGEIESELKAKIAARILR
jgi:hypothetical protein